MSLNNLFLYSFIHFLEPPYPQPQCNKVFLTIDLTPQVLEEALSDPKVNKRKQELFTLFLCNAFLLY